MPNHAAMSPSAMINWLTMAKFSGLKASEKLNAIWFPLPEDKQDAAIEYLRELSRLPEPELVSLFDAEIAKVFGEAQLEAEVREAGFFFSAPGIYADHLFWVRSLFWTPEQAVALSLNRNPVVVNAASLEANGAAGTAFATEYAARLYLVQQSIRFGLLEDSIAPDAFLKWLKRMGLNYPAQMQTAAEAMNYQLTDWEAEYQSLAVEFDALELKAETAITKLEAVEREYAARILEQAQELGAQSELIERLEAEIASLETENEAAETEKPNKSLQKMVLGMAMKSYHYVPGGKRNSAVTNIVSAVEAAGLSITDDTIRKQLKTAAALLLPKPKSGSQAPK